MIQQMKKYAGLVLDLNPGPLAPKAGIIPLDQRGCCVMFVKTVLYYLLEIDRAVFQTDISSSSNFQVKAIR